MYEDQDDAWDAFVNIVMGNETWNKDEFNELFMMRGRAWDAHLLGLYRDGHIERTLALPTTLANKSFFAFILRHVWTPDVLAVEFNFGSEVFVYLKPPLFHDTIPTKALCDKLDYHWTPEFYALVVGVRPELLCNLRLFLRNDKRQ